ncbi:hypothetical protein [Streptomyces sp. NPDC005970]|uniref:hypothetical protein n=1 Tax=Streptomyces sp. NPDC005970 TaxID=3156723 RepID=UPI0034005221
MGAPPPAEAVKALEDRFGPVSACLLSDRRGSRAWKVATPKGHLALKANAPGSEDTRDKARELEQENRHLFHLAQADAVDRAYRIECGTWEGGRWLAVRWIEGELLWRAFRLARRPEGTRPSVQPWLLGIARTWAQRLAAMHAAGWAHADVQPTNTLVTNSGTAEVIDYALACGPGQDERVPYRGALTHTTAPEVAEAILSTSDDTHVQAGPRQTFGAWARPCSGAGQDIDRWHTRTIWTAWTSSAPSQKGTHSAWKTYGHGPSRSSSG